MAPVSSHQLSKLIFCLLGFLLAWTLCAQEPEKLAESEGKAADLTEIPGDLLIALGHKARINGEYSQGIRMLETALDSPYGNQQFTQGLEDALKETDRLMDEDAREKLQDYLDNPKQKNIVEITVKEIDRVRDGKNGARKMQIETRILVKKALPPTVWTMLLKTVAKELQAQLKERFPRNPLNFYSHQNRYYFEGYFNAEYPDIIPQAHYELGLLYKDYQDFVMADIHLQQAIQNRQYFPSKEMVYAAFYEQAILYLYSGKLNKYEETLKLIAAEQNLSKYTAGDGQPLFNRIRRPLLNDPAGMDRVVQLYRLPDDFSREAHRLLGSYYLSRSDYEEALPHLVYAVLQIASTLMQEIRKEVPDYQFTSLKELLDTAESWPEFKTYLSSSKIYESMYQLASALVGYQGGSSVAGTALMKTLAALSQAGQFSIKAKAYLK